MKKMLDKVKVLNDLTNLDGKYRDKFFIKLVNYFADKECLVDLMDLVKVKRKEDLTFVFGSDNYCEVYYQDKPIGTMIFSFNSGVWKLYKQDNACVKEISLSESYDKSLEMILDKTVD